jgi:hypothetical protein
VAVGAAGLAAAAPPGPAPGAAQGFSGEIELMLDRALRNPGQADGSDLMLWFEADRGQWKRIWGKGYTISEHPGLVEAAEVTPDKVRLKVRMLVRGDFWVHGLWAAVFDLSLDRRPDGSLAGRYEGEFQGQRLEGEATGRLHLPRPVREGFVPVRPGEHPRLLFRKSDLARLRDKLKTPFGQAYLEAAKAAGDPVNLGMLYQLTGDRAWAERALAGSGAETVGGKEMIINDHGAGSGGFGHDAFLAGVAYDLCQDAWPAEVTARMQAFLGTTAERHQRMLMTSYANYHPCSNYYGPGRGVAGIASLATWGDPAPAPKEPPDPVGRAWAVAPPKDYRPAAGVPVETFALGRTPARWIWTGLLPYEVSRDLLAKLGGYEGARPDLSTTAVYIVKSGTWFKQADLTFKPLPEGLASEAGLDFSKASADGAGSVSVYFTNLRVDGEHVLRRMPGRDGVRVFLSGVEIADDKLYRVQPGVHPMTVEVRVEKTAGLMPIALVEADPQADTGPVGIWRISRALWAEDKALWDQSGMDPQRQEFLDRGWFQLFQHYRWGMGDGGFQAETGAYAQIGSWYPSVYASMYANFFGRRVSPYPDVDHLIPRYIMQSFFGEGGRSAKKSGGRPDYTKLNSVVTLNPQWMACHFPIIPDRYKPSALWVWNWMAAGRGDADPAEVIGADKQSIWNLRGLTLAQTFLHYPLDMKPVHPRQGMPLSWRADTFGFYVWRSGWDGGPEFVAQVFAKAAPVRGWNHPNAAGFTLRGLGHDWTTAPTSRNGAREQYSVVLLPDDSVNQGACGRVIHHEARPDGSGALSIDLGDVYAAPSGGLYSGMLVRHGRRLKASGITGLRAFGFDYSGASGAPALVAIVDRISGGGKRLWTWHRPEGAAVETRTGGFTLRQGDATMRATFVAPAGVPVAAPGPEDVQVGDPRHGFHGTVDWIKAASPGGAGDDGFFVILTIQRGDPPPVKVEGEGLGARVTVGGRTLRFDGEKIVFGE